MKIIELVCDSRPNWNEQIKTKTIYDVRTTYYIATDEMYNMCQDMHNFCDWSIDEDNT